MHLFPTFHEHQSMFLIVLFTDKQTNTGQNSPCQAVADVTRNVVPGYEMGNVVLIFETPQNERKKSNLTSSGWTAFLSI